MVGVWLEDRVAIPDGAGYLEPDWTWLPEAGLDLDLHADTEQSSRMALTSLPLVKTFSSPFPPATVLPCTSWCRLKGMGSEMRPTTERNGKSKTQRGDMSCCTMHKAVFSGSLLAALVCAYAVIIHARHGPCRLSTAVVMAVPGLLLLLLLS